MLGEAEGIPEAPKLQVLGEGVSGHSQGVWGPEKATSHLKRERTAGWQGQEVGDQTRMWAHSYIREESAGS